jgi:hypothetical protein
MVRSSLRPLSRIDARVAVVLITGVFILAYCLLYSRPLFAQSAATQQFFGFSGGGGGGSGLPASCDISKLQAQIKVLESQLAQVNNDEQSQLKQLQAEQSNLKPGDTAGGDALNAQQQEILDTAKAKLADIKAQEEVIHKQTEGPSDQCKQDTVAQAVAEISGEAAFFSGGGPATLGKVSAELTKIENMLPTLQANGVNSKDIATIKKAVTDVKGDTATLNGFFNAMAAKSSAFLAQAGANPLATYNAMQGGGGPLAGVGSGAAGAADNLVSSFTNLVNLFDKLSGTGGQ